MMNMPNGESQMDCQSKKIHTVVRSIRRIQLAALDKAANKCLAAFPDAMVEPASANLLFHLLAAVAQESLDVYLQQLARNLDEACREAWTAAAQKEAADMIAEVEASA